MSTPAEPEGYVIQTPRGRYAVDTALARGDLATLYRGRALAGERAGQAVAVKIADDAADNDLLHREVQTLRLLQAVDSPLHKQLAFAIDQFRTEDGRVGTILPLLEAYDLVAVRERHPQGVGPQHMVWMMRRLLSVLGFAHRQGIIHGNVEPSHVLVSPPDHNVFLVDWTCAVHAPARTGERFRWHNPVYSAPEVAEDGPPVPASDLYSVGKCMVLLLGGDPETDALPDDLDERFQRLVRFFTLPSPLQRARDAWEMFEELAVLREKVFGPHRFLEFHM